MDAEPENDRNVVGTQHTITATTSQPGQEVNFNVQGPGDPDSDASDFECQTDAQAPFQCAYTYTSNAAGTDTINVWSDEEGANNDDVFQPGEPNDEVTKVWVAQADVRVDCTPDTDTNPEGFTHTVTCTMSDAGGTVHGGQIDAEFLAGSPNDPGGNESGAPADVNNICDANESAAGQCTYTWTGNNPGTDVVCFFVDEDNNNDVDDADCGTEAAQGTGTGADDADDADVVEKTWVRPSRLDCTPETDTNPNGTQHQINCVFTDANGNVIQLPEAQLIDFEIISGPNANLTNGFRDFECPSNDPTTQNNCTGTYTDGQQFDANNATDVICAWISHDGDDDQYDPNGAPEDGGDCDNEAPGTVDNDETDVVLKTWQAPPPPAAATQIDAEPEQDTNPLNTRHDIYVIARDLNNAATTGPNTAQGATTNCNQAAAGGATGACPTRVRADILPGSPNANTQAPATEIQCAASGQNPNAIQAGSTPSANNATHICSYVGTVAGTDQIMVFYDTNDNGLFEQGEPSDQVQKTWGGNAFALALTPDTDTANAGTCNEFTVTVTDQGGNPVVGQFVDVQQTLQNAGQAPAEQRELFFCNPQNATGPNPTGQGNTVFQDSPQTNPLNLQQQPARNTTRHAEVGPTNSAGQVTFGIAIRCGNQPGPNQQGDISCIQSPATVQVRAWVDVNNDNDTFEAGEPTDAPSTKTWNPGGGGAVTGLDATPETATNPNGTQHQVTVQLTGAGGPVANVTPSSVIVTNASGRPQGDVADANAGTSPNAQAQQGQFNVYNCTPSNAQGQSTCTFNDPVNTPPGTDTIVFYVNQAGGGTAGPDAGEPQDAVQKTWTAGPQNLTIDVTCAGTGTGDDRDVGENNPGGNAPNGTAENGNLDCTNPLSDPDEVFTANITDANGIGQQNVRVDFGFGNIVGGNQAGTSANDATLSSGAGGGGQVGTSPQGLQTYCLTDATGRCSVTLNNPTPVAGDTINVVGTISGQTVPGTASDTATKQWQAGRVNQGGTVTLTPRAATNQVGTQHTVTATVRNQFGQPVQGANVDFRITQGPNQGLAQAGMLDATTDANGNATFTYTSNLTGTDTIVACSETGGSENDNCDAGEPSATAFKTWQTGPVTTNAVALDMDADDGGNAGATGNPGQCELTTSGADPNRESTAQNTINPTPGGTLAAGNFHRICAAAFQTNQAGNNGRIAGAQITFTIAGPGRIYAATANGGCTQTAQPPAGTTVTVTADNNGYAFACLYSQQVGRTTVTATSGTPAQSATGTKDWVVNPNTARNIQLCHGDIAGNTCDTAVATNAPGEDHEMTARVTDAQGNPVANVPVQFRETGPAIFIPQGGSTATVNTDANGLASVLLRSGVEGTSTVVAEISPENTPGTFRNPGANNDECERAAGTNNQPTAGNCISQTLTKNWQTATTPPPTTSSPPTGGWERDVDLEASKNRKRFGKSFTLSGTVELPDPNAPASCRAGVTVEIQRDVVGGNDDFVLFDTLTTDAQGAFTGTYTADRSANYVAFVGHSGTGNEECAEGSSTPEPVLVRVAVRLKINKTRVDRGERVTLRVKFLPCEGHEGDKALLFKSIQGKFGKIGKKRTNDNCVAKFRKRVFRSSVFQARWPKQDADHLQGKSRPKAVQVRRR